MAAPGSSKMGGSNGVSLASGALVIGAILILVFLNRNLRGVAGASVSI